LSLFSSNLATRVGTAVVALPALLAVFFLAPAWVGAGLIGAACVVALHEFFALLRARGIAPLSEVGYLVLALAFVDVARPDMLPPLFPIVMLVGAGLALRRAGTMPESVTAAALTLFGAAYLGALGGCMAGLVLLEPAADGPWRMVLLMAIIMTADTAAFFAGKRWGRRKLAPQVSPGKTIAGAIGALVGGVPAALLVSIAALPQVPARDAVGLGIAVAAFGMIGDLAESLMKRWAGVKDSGAFFPGHGGMLDRVDSLLFGAPVLYYYFLFTPAG
jgi:phosphatidate cytidylyltransferase